ncbi:hypothetical protein IMSAGC019_03165 [Lachnospiraceae bacterium]|nr:hypothetical protein IMSAGC019_03165 [Lachnospiraceae bacterium]
MVIILAALLGGGFFLAQRMLYARWWSREVYVFLRFGKEMVRAGETTCLWEVVENRKRLPLSSLKVKFQCSRHLVFSDRENGMVTDRYYRNDLFSIMPYQRITRTHQLTCPQRGYYAIEGIDLVGADLFFSEEMTAYRKSGAAVYVTPKMLSGVMLEPALRKISGEIAARRYELEDPFTCRGIREYEPWDEIRKINWKASARMDELMVNEREHTTVSSLRIFMNLEDSDILKRQELVEMSISLCAALAREFLIQGIQVSVYANGRDCITGQLLSLEGLNAASSVDAVDRALARLEAQGQLPRFGDCLGEKLFGGSALYTVFISAYKHEDYLEVLRRFHRERGEGFVWVCPVGAKQEELSGWELAGRTLYVQEG